MNMPMDAGDAGRWTKLEREMRGLSGRDLADRINVLAKAGGDPTIVSQQVVSKFEQGTTKRMPAWCRYIEDALQVEKSADNERGKLLSTDEASLHVKVVDISHCRQFPYNQALETCTLEVFARSLVQDELKARAEALVTLTFEGNGMEPDFRGGDRILVDTQKAKADRPGAYCYWDGQSYQIRYVEKIYGSNPPRYLICSGNAIYSKFEALEHDITIIGKVVWVGRRIF